MRRVLLVILLSVGRRKHFLQHLTIYLFAIGRILVSEILGSNEIGWMYELTSEQRFEAS